METGAAIITAVPRLHSPRNRRAADHRMQSMNEALCQCSAVLRAPDEPEFARIRSLPVIAMLSLMGFFWATALWLEPGAFISLPCCLFLDLPACLLWWFVCSPWLGRRGRLLLYEDHLVFRRPRKPPVTIELHSIMRAGRARNRIHVALADHRSHYYFSCSRLHAEDLYDQLLEQLAALGVEVVSHERKG